MLKMSNYKFCNYPMRNRNHLSKMIQETFKEAFKWVKTPKDQFILLKMRLYFTKIMTLKIILCPFQILMEVLKLLKVNLIKLISPLKAKRMKILKIKMSKKKWQKVLMMMYMLYSFGVLAHGIVSKKLSKKEMCIKKVY